MKHFQQFLVQVETLELDIQRGKFHSALKVIEDLRTEYIPTLNDFTFVKILGTYIIYFPYMLICYSFYFILF